MNAHAISSEQKGQADRVEDQSGSSRESRNNVVMNDVFTISLRRLWVILVGDRYWTGYPGFRMGSANGESTVVAVAKGTKLCSNTSLEQSRGTLDSGKVFWKVRSNVRANGTQTVAAFVLEAI